MDGVDVVFTCIFTVEMLIQMFALGCYKDTGEEETEKAYLSTAWNRLDFFVVVTSWVSIVVDVLNVETVIKTSTLRALRILRVVKSLRFFAGIQTIIHTLAGSIRLMGNIMARRAAWPHVARPRGSSRALSSTQSGSAWQCVLSATATHSPTALCAGLWLEPCASRDSAVPAPTPYA